MGPLLADFLSLFNRHPGKPRHFEAAAADVFGAQHEVTVAVNEAKDADAAEDENHDKKAVK